MAPKTIFAPAALGRTAPSTDTRNSEGAPAYSLSKKAALAQYAATGTFQKTFYATGEAQLEQVQELCREVEPEFIAKTAAFARKKGFMKDMPAFLLAYLAGLTAEASQRAEEARQEAKKAPEASAEREGFQGLQEGLEDEQRELGRLLEQAFPKVADNGKMIRNFAQIIRSGKAGRKSFGSQAKRLIREWFQRAPDWVLLDATVGNDPSLADVVRMVHPKPRDDSQRAFFGWLLGKEHSKEALPDSVKAFEAFKRDPSGTPPRCDFRLLTSLPLTKGQWTEVAKRAGWQALRMNLNTFLRHGVFENGEAVETIARRLRDPDEIRRARVFPYQLLAAWTYADFAIPQEIRKALEDAMDVAIENVPEIPGNVALCVDTSGSMDHPVTGQREGATSKIQCRQAAALLAAAIRRRNPAARIIPFHSEVSAFEANPKWGVMETASQLGLLPKGGTSCSAPLALLNQERARVDLVIFASDYESWVDQKLTPNRPPNCYGVYVGGSGNQPTETMRQWEVLKARNPGAKMVCVDLAPSKTVQALEREDIFQAGGFSDYCFQFIRDVAEGRASAAHWVREIEAVEI